MSEENMWFLQAKEDLLSAKKVDLDASFLINCEKLTFTMDRKKNIEKVRIFKKELKKIDVDKLILFGSRANGKPTKYSDFDILIVSPSFKKKNVLNRAIGFHKYWKYNSPVDFLCYTPEEFKKMSKKVTLVREAVRNGIEIK